MQIQKVQSRPNTYFTGTIKIQNFRKGNECIVKETSVEFDKGLADMVLKNLFDGDWSNGGVKNIKSSLLTQYTDVLRQTLGINLLRNLNKSQRVELKCFDNGYSINAQGQYKITHNREDYTIWE